MDSEGYPLNKERAQRLARWYKQLPNVYAIAYRAHGQWRIQVVYPLKSGGSKTYDVPTLHPAGEVTIREIMRWNQAPKHGEHLYEKQAKVTPSNAGYQ